MSIRNKDINKIIARETAIISKKYALDDDNLVIKFSASEVKTAVKYDAVEKRPISRFKNDFISVLNQMSAYGTFEAEKIELEFDPKCDPAYLNAFLKAWKDYFALKIYRKNKDIKNGWKKNIVSLVLGIIALAVVIGFGVAGVYNESKGFRVAAVCIDAVFSIIAWVFIWEFFYDIVYTLGGEKIKMAFYYKMYKAEVIELVPVPAKKPEVKKQETPKLETKKVENVKQEIKKETK